VRGLEGPVPVAGRGEAVARLLQISGEVAEGRAGDVVGVGQGVAVARLDDEGLCEGGEGVGVGVDFVEDVGGG